MVTSLITGGAGFIGSHVVENCILLNHKVVILDDLSGGFKENIPSGAIFIHGSINDLELLKKLFEDYKFDYVYHLAAYAAEGLSHYIRIFNYQNNLMGSINLINLSVFYKIKCFIFTSSIAVYGSGQLPMTEDMVPEPEDPYGIAKYAIELDLKAAFKMFGLNHVIFRPHNVYGERQNIADKYRNVIGIFMNQIMQGQDICIFGDGKQTRAFSYIDDISKTIARSAEVQNSYNETFNIGADMPYSINLLSQVIAKEFGINAVVKHLDARQEILHAHSDHSKVESFFGKANHTPLEEGIKKMADWAKKSGGKTSKEFENIEIEKNLPDSWKKQS